MMTCCHFGIKREHRLVEFGRVVNFGRGIQLWHFFSKLTKSSLIIHIIMTCGHFGIIRGGKNHEN